MSSPNKPANELERLKELYSLKILYTEQEQVYDDITAIAANIMGTPSALITFLDSDVNWFKSKIGFNAISSPRDVSFCAHAILTPNQPTIVPDATLDERFFDNPQVTGSASVRFYFGSPLITSNSKAIGVLCAIDTVARKQPSEVQINSLKSLSRLVVTHLELRSLIIDTHEEIEKITNYNLENKIVEKLDTYNELFNKCDLLLKKVKMRRETKLKQ